jgi:hypothetical protein
VAGHDCPFDPVGIEQRDHVGRKVLDAIATTRFVRVAVPALRHRDGVYLAR